MTAPSTVHDTPGTEVDFGPRSDGYRDAVATNEDDARSAQARAQKARAAEREALSARDAAIWRMHAEDEYGSTAIARSLGVAKSTVIVVLRAQRALHQRRK